MTELLTNPCFYIVVVQLYSIYRNSKEHRIASDERMAMHEQRMAMLTNIKDNQHGAA